MARSYRVLLQQRGFAQNGVPPSALLIHEVAGERPVSAALEDAIASRADGVPLFVEELTRSVLESTFSGGNDAALGASPLGKASIPSTLHGLLLARFDRLDRGKAVAQAGAVIGQAFSFELLHLVAGLDEPALRGALDQLVASGLVFRRGVPPQASYVFKHALVRDAAYGLLLRERRQKLHANVAQSYEEHFQETTEAQPELLAYHHREAGNPAKALSYLITASERALSRSAMTEAIAQSRLALNLLATLPENADTQKLELKVQIALARGLVAVKGPAAPDAAQAYNRARALCETLNDIQMPLRSSVLFQQGIPGQARWRP